MTKSRKNKPSAAKHIKSEMKSKSKGATPPVSLLSPADPLGSYTGVPSDPREMPTQDADDQ